MRTTTLRGALTFVILLTLTVVSSFGQSLTRGTVVDLDKKPVEGALVTFEAQFQKLTRETKTDRKGEFLFVGLPTGKYKITAKKDDRIDTVTADVSGAEKRVIEFTLRPVGGVVVITPPAGPPVPPALREAAVAAIVALQAQPPELETAVVKLREVIAARPSCFDCFMFLGASYAELSRYEEAEDALKKSVDIQPTPDGYLALTRFYAATGKQELAADANKKFGELTNNQVDLLAGSRANQNAATSSVPTAETQATDFYNSGAKLWNAGKQGEAKPMFEAAVKADPSNTLALYMLGMAHVSQGEFPQARSIFEGYLKVAPSGDKVAEVKSMLTQLPK